MPTTFFSKMVDSIGDYFDADGSSSSACSCEVNWNLRIICQKRKSGSDATTIGGERGIVTLKEATVRRKQLFDEANAVTMACLESVLKEDGNIS